MINVATDSKREGRVRVVCVPVVSFSFVVREKNFSSLYTKRTQAHIFLKKQNKKTTKTKHKYRDKKQL
jgi:hypothetical protein